MSRIKGEHAALSHADTLAFFERRASKVKRSTSELLAVTTFRDRETADRRHQAELDQSLPLLGLTATSRVLEIGCGAGRWGQSLLGEIAQPVEAYVGVDFSPSLIAMAETAHASLPAKFFVMGADTLDEDALAACGPYTHVIVCAMLLYVNDDAVRKMMASLARLTARGTVLYVREPISVGGERLTLIDEYSEAIQDQYNAVYRCDEEYKALIAAGGAFELRADALMADPLFKSFSETQHKLYLAART